MKKFLVTYHAPVESMEQMASATPDQQAKGMEEWMNWAKRCGDHLVDMGSPLLPGQRLETKNEQKNSTNQVCGYSILQASGMDEAKELMKNHPHTNGWNQQAAIEIHETMQMPGM